MMDDGTFDVARFQDPLTIQTILNRAKTIAIVGLSANPLRGSYFVGFYLRRHGYRIIPVNPRLSDWLGEMSYESLSEIPPTSRSTSSPCSVLPLLCPPSRKKRSRGPREPFGVNSPW